jgi:hypothetical protein
MYVQAVQFGNYNFEVKLYNTEMETTSYMTAITLDTIEVEFNVADYVQNDFNNMKKDQLAKLKADIMKNAQDQCAALDEKS